MKRIFLFAMALIAPFTSVGAPSLITKAGFDQRLNETVPMDVRLQNDQGQTVQLGHYLKAHPAILLPAYYGCPNLCPLTLEGLAESLGQVSAKIQKDYQVVAVSIDPRETPSLAADKKTALTARFPGLEIADRWHFLTGEDDEIRRLMRAIGFRYAYDPKLDQYAHAAGIVLLTEQGRIARYFYGVRFAPMDLRLGLVETARRKIGSPIDQLLLLCYHYDPVSGRYSPLIMQILRLAGLATVLLIGASLILMLRRERRRKRLATRDEGRHGL